MALRIERAANIAEQFIELARLHGHDDMLRPFDRRAVVRGNGEACS